MCPPHPCPYPPQILVHGEQNEMARLKAALIREYEDNDQVHIEVHNPRNTEAVTLNFRGEKLAKVSQTNWLVFKTAVPPLKQIPIMEFTPKILNRK